MLTWSRWCMTSLLLLVRTMNGLMKVPNIPFQLWLAGALIGAGQMHPGEKRQPEYGLSADQPRCPYECMYHHGSSGSVAGPSSAPKQGEFR